MRGKPVIFFSWVSLYITGFPLWWTRTSLTWWMSPGLPRFSRSSASVYYNERKPKNKKRARPGNEARHYPWITLGSFSCRMGGLEYVDSHELHYWPSVETLAAWLGIERNRWMMLNICMAWAFHELKPVQNRAMNLINPHWILVNITVLIEINESH